ncbi:MAG: gluconate 2-dehydrogenase subunit 3 family protein [Alphaproteobacteria bacterium]|nr:gluconate 2-dehydrogenase subunit 3 family protein [Alphaproteobacteria bacterium]
MPDRYPGYDVLAKRHTPSWNAQTRRVIDARLALPAEPRFFSEEEWATLGAVCARIVPQPKNRPPIPVAALVDHKLNSGNQDGYRNAKLPPMGEAWRRGLAALDSEARRKFGARFHQLDGAEQDTLLKRAEAGDLDGPAWGDMPPALFFTDRLLRDILHGYYAHPTAWNEIGFGGPAAPRGYVRMGFDRRDPWEAAEVPPDATDREVEKTRRENRRVG